MNIFKVMHAATLGNTKVLRPMVGWTILEYVFRGLPYGILLLVAWELFKPLQYEGTSLDTNKIIIYCVILAISLVLLYLVTRKSYFAAFKDSYEICANGRLKIAEHLRKLPMGFYTSRDPGDLGAYIVNDYANIETLLSHHLPQLIGGISMSLVLLVSLSFFSWKLALAAALVIPLAMPSIWLARKLVESIGRKQMKTKTEVSSRTIEYVQGIQLIKAFNIGGIRFERMEKVLRLLTRQSIRLEALGGPSVLFGSFILHFGFTFVILLGTTFLVSGEVALPVYVLFLIMGTRVYEPLIQSLVFIGEMSYYGISIDRISKLLETQPLVDGGDTNKIEDYSIEFKNVDFSYNEKLVLNNISFKLPSHSLTAFVGPSGSGKTTITRLIARFWDVNSGDILLGNKSLKDYSQDHLLSQISVVFQDVYLFNDTVINNIHMAKPNASVEEVYNAAKKARCHGFVSSLPQGYDTMIGESGSTLSGGEKQRISIARAILKDAPIILLDEATASLDPENELHIQEAINDLVKDKTVLVIAHRLNTIAGADQIVVLNNGSVEQQGKHEELLQKNGLYQNMWEEQQRVKGWKF